MISSTAAKSAETPVLSADAEGLVLETVAVEASLTGLLADVRMLQRYRNREKVPIESIYSFPLPLDAVLLEVSLELNGRTLKGIVQEKGEAGAAYEVAVDDGDSAVLLENPQPGLFTMNLANLLPGESAVIRIRYGQLLKWQGERVRFYVPTTLAPRYGDPANAGLLPHQTPEHVLTSDRSFSLSVSVRGALSAASCECPSHRIAVRPDQAGMHVHLADEHLPMDRDFVLVFHAVQAAEGCAYRVRDGERFVSLASFHPRFPQQKAPPPRCVKFVIDCSGSMAGTSIEQARLALEAIIETLRDCDFFNLTTFGTSHHLLFPTVVRADAKHLAIARHALTQLSANLGGTEIGSALYATYRSGTPEGMACDLMLITDGEVWDGGELAETARLSSHRIFTVGVGTAIAEDTLRRLAEATGGACALVSPSERMGERIVEHFRRIDQVRACNQRVDWPVRPIFQAPETIASVYEGDTLHVFAWTDEPIEGEVVLKAELPDGATVSERLRLTGEVGEDSGLIEVLSRLAAFHRLPSLDHHEALALALEFQLITVDTACVLVHERDDSERAQDLPEVRKIPQVLAAGWGGTGMLACEITQVYPEALLSAPRLCEMDSPLRASIFDAGVSYDDEPTREIAEILARLFRALESRSLHRAQDFRRYECLVDLGVAPDIIDSLRALEPECTEELLVRAFIAVLLDDSRGKLDRNSARVIRLTLRIRSVPVELKQRIKERVGGLLAD